MKDLRERSPRVHCITNYVTAGDVANMVLAAGGSPVMAQGLHEVEDVTSICSSLVLNLGTLEEKPYRPWRQREEKLPFWAFPLSWTR